jgi:hypothetical protein
LKNLEFFFGKTNWSGLKYPKMKRKIEENICRKYIENEHFLDSEYD